MVYTDQRLGMETPQRTPPGHHFLYQRYEGFDHVVIVSTLIYIDFPFLNCVRKLLQVEVEQTADGVQIDLYDVKVLVFGEFSKKNSHYVIASHGVSYAGCTS